MLRRHLQRTKRDEGGSALLIALVMVFIVSIIVAAVLNYSGTSLRANSAVSEDGKSQYAADGAIETAIQNLSDNAALCATKNATVPALDLPAVSDTNQPAVHVDCERTNDASSPGTGDEHSDQPKYAVQTMGRRANMPSNKGSYNWGFTSVPPWGQVVESGVYFQPGITGLSCGGFLNFCYKQTGDVLIAGSVMSNSTVAANNPTGSTPNQTIKTTDPSQFGFTVRQGCKVSSRAAISPDCRTGSVAAPSQIIGYGGASEDVGKDPAYPSRGQWQASQAAGFPAKQTVPACGAGTLVTFEPGWYDDANALNQLFRTCANGDGTGKDYWFRPGVYYFDFRNPTGNAAGSQYCGVGIDNSPIAPRNQSQMNSSSSFAHQWCIRGQNASDGTAKRNRPTIVGGTPKDWGVDPITRLMAAASATSSTFSPANNGTTINGSSATTTWTDASRAMVPGQAASNTFTAPNNGRVIDTDPSTRTLQNTTTTQTPANAATSHFSNAPDGRVIGGGFASHTLTNSSTLEPTVATSSQVVSGTDDFATKDSGRTIDGTTSAASFTRNQTLAATDTDGSVGSNDDFTNPGGGEQISTSTNDNNMARFRSDCSPSPCESGQIILDDYPDLPSGAIPTNVTLTVRHRQGATTNIGTLRINLVAANGSAIAGCSVNLNTAGALSTSYVTYTTGSIPSACVDTKAEIDALRLSYEAQANNSGDITFYLDGIAANVTYVEGSNRTLALSSEAPPLSTSAVVEAARLEVAHQDNANANPRLVLSGTNLGGKPTSCTTIPLTASGSLTPDTRDFHAHLVGNCTISTGALAATINGLTVTYTVNASGAAPTAIVDGIRIVTTATDTNLRTLTLSGVSPNAPTNTPIERVTVSVRHQETADNLNPTLIVTPGDASAPCTFAVTSRTTMTTDPVEVASCLNSPAKVNGATYRYQVNLTPNGAAQSANVNVDGIEVVVLSTDTTVHEITLSSLSNQLPTTGYVVNSAVLSFAHRETGAGLTPTLVVTPGGGGAPCTYSLTPRATLAPPDTIDLGNCLNTPAKVNGATIKYQVHLTALGTAQSGAASVDGASLAVQAVDTPTRAIELTSFAPSVPASAANLASLTVKVAHSESAGTNPLLVITPSGGTACAPISLPSHATLASDTVTVPSACITSASKLNGAKLEYRVTGAGGATAAFDGAEVAASYYTRPAGLGDSATDGTGVACDPNQPGVQFMFGGDSHVYIPDASFELCAGPSPGNAGEAGYTAQQIALYGVPPTAPMVASQVLANPGGYSNASPATFRIGDYEGDANLITADASIGFLGGSKSITLGGFNATPVPAGMAVDKVTARVSHGEEGLISDPQVTFTNGQAQSCGTQTLGGMGWLNPATWLGPAYEEVDLTSCFNTAEKLAGASVTFTANGGFLGLTEHLDGIEIDVTFKPATPATPVFMPQSGCTTAYPNYWDGYNNPDCALMKWDSVEDVLGDFPNPCVPSQPACLPNGQVSLQGTIYTPGSAIAIDDQGKRMASGPGCSGGDGSACYTGVDYPVFNRGVIARTLRFNSFKAKPGYGEAVVACAGAACTGGVIHHPREVTLTAYVCNGAAPCSSASGKRRIEAKVTIPLDTNTQKPKVTSWKTV